MSPVTVKQRHGHLGEPVSNVGSCATEKTPTTDDQRLTEFSVAQPPYYDGVDGDDNKREVKINIYIIEGAFGVGFRSNITK